jgi:phosphoglycolate phosphatase
MNAPLRQHSCDFQHNARMGAGMRDFPFAIVGFDLDGTLVDTSGDLVAATNHALAIAGRPSLSQDRIKSMIGGGAKHMLIDALESTGGYEPESFKPLYRALLGYYEANISVHSRPFPGVIEALDALAACGAKIAIVTNKFERLAVKLLGDLDLLERFETVIGGDTLGKENAKPSPAPINEMIARLGGGRAVFIGDSRYDIMAARAANVTSIAVSFGFLLEPVETMNADHIIDSYEDLIPLLAAI